MKTHEFADKLIKLQAQSKLASNHAEWKALNTELRYMLANYAIGDTETVIGAAWLESIEAEYHARDLSC